MRITGIVSEYNPIHSGHKYHIEKTKNLTSSDGIIAIMSGNFVQRGLPAIIDKWTRTKMALNSGIDLVIELPVIYSLSSAEFFSFGAISLLDQLGLVDYVSFGSEVGDIDLLMNIGKILSTEPLVYGNILKSKLQSTMTFPKSRSEALLEYFRLNNISYPNIETTLASSNNILGIEYCKSLYKIGSKIQPVTINRLGSDYNSMELNTEFISATALRACIKNNSDIREIERYIPKNVSNIMEDLLVSNYPFTSEDSMLPFLKYKINCETNNISNIPDASEGIDKKIESVINSAHSYSELVSAIKSKRYTYSRISRILCQYFIGFDEFNTKELRKAYCPYGRILGFNEKGAEILKQAKNTSKIPLYTKIPKDINQTLKLDIQATKAYSLLNSSIKYNSDFLNKPIICNK